MREAVLGNLEALLDEEWKKTKRLLLSLPGVSWSEINFVATGLNIESYGLALVEPTQEQLQVAARAFALIPFSLFAQKEQGQLFPGLSGGTTVMWFERDAPSVERFSDRGKRVVAFYMRGGWAKSAQVRE